MKLVFVIALVLLSLTACTTVQTCSDKDAKSGKCKKQSNIHDHDHGGRRGP